MSGGLFVTATGTDVGKTFVAALIVKALRDAGLSAGYYKAALSGAERVDGVLIPGDAAYVEHIAGNAPGAPSPANRDAGRAASPFAGTIASVSYVYETPVSPHLAARLEGNPAELEVVCRDYRRVRAGFDYVTVEGSGGIVCPIRMDERRIMLTDIVRVLGLRCLIVVPAGLGAINGAVLTASYAKELNIEVAGFVMNRFHADDAIEEDNRFTIEALTQLPVLFTVADGAACIGWNAARLAALYR